MHNKIIDNEISETSMDAGGAGIGTGIETGDHWVIIENNFISNNSALTNAEFAFGGGINICMNGIIKNNNIDDNYCYNLGTQADGGGIEVYQIPGTTIQVTISDNIISNNHLECHRSEGAGIMIMSGEVMVLNNTINDNYNTAEGFSLGAGIMYRYADNKLKIKNNVISNNSGSLGDNVNVGSGICILEAYDEEIEIDANIISNNVAKHGGGFYERRSYNIHFTNNVFRENSADLGGAMGLYHPSSNKVSTKEFVSLIINNTFYANSANDHAGAIRIEGHGNIPVIINSIFWENSAPVGQDLYFNIDGNVNVSYNNISPSNIYGNWEGDNNINVDPLFTDEYCHIDIASQCIEAWYHFN